MGCSRGTHRRHSLLYTALALVLLLGLVACGSGSTEDGDGAAPGGAETGTDGEQAEGQTFSFTIGGPHSPEGAPWVRLLIDEFMPTVQDRVSSETPHSVEFTEGWGGSIAGSDEVSEAVETGVLDLGYVTAPAESSRFPLQNFPYWLPFGPSDPAVVYEATSAVYDEFSELGGVFEDQYNQKFLGFTVIQNYGVVSNTEINTLDDVDGLRVGGIGPNLDLVRVAGGVGVTAAIPDMYPNIQSGVMDAMIILPAAIVGTKMWEVAPHWISTDFGSLSPHMLTMNLDRWNELPEDVQQIFRDAAEQWSQSTAEVAASTQEENLQTWEENGGTIVDLPQEEREAWAEAFAADYVKSNAEAADEAGLPGTEVIQAYIEAAQEQGYELPRDWEF